VAEGDGSLVSLDEVAKEHIRRVLDACGWQIDGQHGAAASLGLRPSTLRSRMKKLGLHKPSRVSS
jgi:transcriptional regulator with GAF, ATPase, and Fis domain